MEIQDTFNTEAIDLSNCDREPIHIPGKIQPFGFLLAADLKEWALVQYSENTERHVGMTCRVGMNLSELLNAADFEKIAAAVEQSKLVLINPLPLRFANGTSYQSMLHINSQGLLLIECETITNSYLLPTDYYTAANHLIQRLKSCCNIVEICDRVAKEIRQITGYDRVMVYRFDEEWNGKVVAESRRADLYSFYGHHFPATDIPLQARRLYTENILRMIPDIGYAPVRIIPADTTKAPLDLSHAFLRSVSPIHIEYMQNMGVRATLVISLMLNNRLWGLIACHHYDVKFVDVKMRLLLEHLGGLIAHHIGMMEQLLAHNHYLQVKSYESEIIKHIAHKRDPLEGMLHDRSLLLKLNSASGVTIWWDDDSFSVGITPPKALIAEIVQWLFDNNQDSIFYTDCLKNVLHGAERYASVASGILSIRLSNYDKKFIIWFKPETIQTIIWGGNPNEKASLQLDEGNFRLSPRKSFEKWEEVVRHRAVRWHDEEIQIAKDFRLFIIEQIANQSVHLQAQNAVLKLKIEEKTREIREANHRLQEFNEELAQQNEELKGQSEELIRIKEYLEDQQRQLRAIFDHTKHVIFLLDKDAKLLFFNKMAQTNARLLHRREIKLGESLKDYLRTDEELQDFEKLFQQALSGQSVVVERKFQQAHEQFNFYRWFQVEYNPMYENQQVVGVIILLIDISDLRRQISYIEQQNETLKEIAYIQSHEIRRPVANIMGLLNIYNHEEPSDPFNREVMDKIQLSARELDAMIAQIVNKTYLIEEFEQQHKLPPTTS